MALDRMNIEKRDFPIGRRGYEPEAVDAHLAVVAVEVEALKRQLESAQAGAPPAAAPGAEDAPAAAAAPVSLAAHASEQVRTIVEAAESSAADIQQAAQNDASQIRLDAQNAAEASRADAEARSQEHLTKVSDGTVGHAPARRRDGGRAQRARREPAHRRRAPERRPRAAQGQHG